MFWLSAYPQFGPVLLIACHEFVRLKLLCHHFYFMVGVGFKNSSVYIAKLVTTSSLLDHSSTYRYKYNLSLNMGKILCLFINTVRVLIFLS